MPQPLGNAALGGWEPQGTDHAKGIDNEWLRNGDADGCDNQRRVGAAADETAQQRKAHQHNTGNGNGFIPANFFEHPAGRNGKKDHAYHNNHGKCTDRRFPAGRILEPVKVPGIGNNGAEKRPAILHNRIHAHKGQQNDPASFVELEFFLLILHRTSTFPQKSCAL